jgi:FtsP/CotA-like multicopper oxidase with cupredoxin domain
VQNLGQGGTLHSKNYLSEFMSLSISRRKLLSSAGALAAASVAAPALAQHAHHDHGGEVRAIEKPLSRAVALATGDDIRFPEVRRSVDGVLETTLRLARGPVDVDGESATVMSFEGQYPGPTLMAKPGDTIKIKLINDLDDVTNLHTHGLHVSPSGNSDNVMLVIQPGETFDYEFKIPEDHMPGTYWYHPHVHGLTYSQVSGGLAGALIIEGGLDEIEGIKDRVDQLLVIQSTQFDENNSIIPSDDQDMHRQTRTVNGQINPTLRIRSGEVQRWRFVNATAESYLMIGLEGHPLYQISKDGNAMTRVVKHDQLLIEPGTRADVLVQGHMFRGAFELRKTLWLGSPRQYEPDELLATLVVDEGDAVTDQFIPEALIPLAEDLRGKDVDRKRTIRFGVIRGEPGGTRFVIDGKQVDMNRVDQTVPLGAFEEWELVNDSPEWHPFHIHANDFQVVAVNGEPVDEVLSWEDTRGIPPNGSLTIRHRFLDFTGKYVYHCHLLFHEDHGMMGIVEVVA